jgi:prepilin-type N-terminal cleavage/methylation domain-containing protein
MTLIEVIVVVAIIGVIASVTALALPRAVAVPLDDPGRALAAARQQALRDGAARSAQLLIDSTTHEIVVLPDGSVIADSSVAIERLTARWRHAP